MPSCLAFIRFPRLQRFLQKVNHLNLCVVAPQIAQAQTEAWLLGPNSRSGPASTVVPTDCVTGDDGSITCNTKIENPAGTTPAKPYYNPFTN
ncbi:hypothetical protein ES708_19385 [subsurface metagenome]